MSGSIVINKQSLERYVILQTVLLHFADTAMQDGFLEESPMTLLAPAVHWQCVPTDMLEGPRVLTVVSIRSLCHCPQVRPLSCP